MTKLQDRVALVTGAAGAIGQEVALELASKGVLVAAVDADQGRLEGLWAKLKKDCPRALVLALDPGQPAEVRAAVDRVLDTFGRIDILVNGMDASAAGKMEGLDHVDWAKTLEANLDPVFLFCREAIPKMKEAKYGRVINLSGIECLGWPAKSSYAAAKAAIFGLTRSLALELARDSITVNSVVKGDILTPEAGLNEEEVASLASRLPVQRLGRPADVASAVGFFASEQAKYVTGQTLFVCGGKSVYYSMSV